jgi:hypothetical protein
MCKPRSIAACALLIATRVNPIYLVIGAAVLGFFIYK